MRLRAFPLNNPLAKTFGVNSTTGRAVAQAKANQHLPVVLPIGDYEKLLEDLDDLAVVAERRDEPAIPHEQFISELKRDGVLC